MLCRLLFLPLLLLSGCAHTAGHAYLRSYDDTTDKSPIHVSSTIGWQDTGISISTGESFHLRAQGHVTSPVTPSDVVHNGMTIGPEGTYLLADVRPGALDPLPTGHAGPAPAYALVGRIGEGPPFLVGEEMSLTSSRSGHLFLRINDSRLTGNAGSFQVVIKPCDSPLPAWHEQIVTAAASPFTASTGNSRPEIQQVIIFYVDGLRPDVIRELALTGHLPTIRRLFLDGGTWVENAMTVFPSSTLTANASMWTGCFPDRTGLTTMIRFNRRTRSSKSHLTPLGPVRAGETLTPVGIARVADQAGLALRQHVRSRTTHIPPPRTCVPLFRILQDQGTDWATGVLPLMPHVAPPLWSRSLLRHLPWLRADRAWEHIDEANTTYAMRHLIAQRRPVTVIWLPETDSVSHKCGRGQFGQTRQTLARVDRLIQELHNELHGRGLLDTTAFMLVSDHGHDGGRTTHLQHYDVAHEVFFRTRHVTPRGQWAPGGGLGMSIHQHQLSNHHPGDKHFVFVDGLSDGTTRIYLPRGDYTSGNWTESQRPADLLAYQVADHLPPVNLLETLANATATTADRPIHPVDLILVRNDSETLLIVTRDRGAAVVSRRRTPGGDCDFSYRVVQDLAPAKDGTIAYQLTRVPHVDPLGLLKNFRPELLAAYVDETTWLHRTLDTPYPDSVVSLARSVLWHPNIDKRAANVAPDVILTAQSGWFFGREPTPGTMHGYPTQASMRATWFLSGPGIRRASRLKTPCRLTDLTPTILDLLQRTPVDVHFDGRPLRGYREQEAHHSIATRPLPWDEVLLTDWSSLDYAPRAVDSDVPRTVNRPDSPTDLNTVIFNLASIPNWSPLRILDDVLGLGHGESVTRAIERSESMAKGSVHTSLSDASGVANISDIAVSDYSPTSVGNLYRIDRLIDWAQRPTQYDTSSANSNTSTDTALPLSALHLGIDRLQDIARSLVALGFRWTVQILDDQLATSLEYAADRVLNVNRHVPAERVIQP